MSAKPQPSGGISDIVGQYIKGQLMYKDIQFIYRGTPGHWDVISEGKRLFAIRGDPGDVRVRDERFRCENGIIGHFRGHPTAQHAASKILDALMSEV